MRGDPLILRDIRLVLSKYKLGILLLFLLLFTRGNVSAQTYHTEIRLNFRVNSCTIDSTYSENAFQLSKISNFAKLLAKDSTIILRKVSLCGSVSPEGNWNANRTLARERLQALERIIKEKIEIPDSIITRNDSYISWQYLQEQIESSISPDRVEILEAISTPIECELSYPANRINRLRSINDGATWWQLIDFHFSPMRNASVIFTYDKQELAPIPVDIPAEPIHNSIVDVAEPQPENSGGGFYRIYI